MTARCWWPGTDLDYIEYHDREWGVPVYEDRALFECLCLEGQQAGLSWITILKSGRVIGRFKHFEIDRVARMQDRTLERLLLDRRLVRNRLNALVQCPCMSGGAGGIRQLQRLYLVFRRRLSDGWQAPKQEKRPRLYSSQRCDVQRPQTPGVYIRGQHNLLRLHAGDRHDQRPHEKLLSLQPAQQSRAVVKKRNNS